MSALFEAQEIGFSYKSTGVEVPIFKESTFQVPSSSFCCLVGPSGTGKTTLLNILGLVEKLQVGRLHFMGTDIRSLTEKEKERLRLRDIGFVFQSFYLLPTLTVRENASYFLPLLGLSKAEANERVDYYLQNLGLMDLEDRYPREISGGQKQRVAIARALVKKPKVILADEPTANLDAATAESIIQVFKQLQKQDDVSFFFSTHDQRLIKYAEHMFKVSDGKIVDIKEFV
jgi:putative ABC transport system ATP-binding protein/lipoprotein-releasing system ATP-binding protein